MSDRQYVKCRFCESEVPADPLSQAKEAVIAKAEAWADWSRTLEDQIAPPEVALARAVRHLRSLQQPKGKKPEEGFYWVIMQGHGAVWQVGQVIPIKGGFEVALCGYPGTYDGEMFDIGPRIPDPQ